MSASLRFEFKTASGASKKMSIQRANPEVSPVNVQSLVAEMIENGEFLWADPPESCVSAVLRVVTDTDINVNPNP